MKYTSALLVAAGIGLTGCARPKPTNPMVVAAREAAKERVVEQVLSVARIPYYPVLMLLGISPTEGIPQRPYSHIYDTVRSLE